MSTFVNLAEVIYPVGSIYESTSSTSPATLFGGTWSSITNRMLIGASSTYAAKATGGEATHKLTVSEIPAHEHVTGLHYADNSGSSTGHATSWTKQSSNYVVAGNTGGGGAAHNNLPPYYGAYMWTRTA